MKQEYQTPTTYVVDLQSADVLTMSQPLNPEDNDVTGNDIMDLGIKGAEIGSVMNSLLDEVMKNPDFNVKEKLLDIAKSHKVC